MKSQLRGKKVYFNQVQEKDISKSKTGPGFGQELKFTPEPFYVTTTINRHYSKVDSKKTQMLSFL